MSCEPCRDGPQSLQSLVIKKKLSYGRYLCTPRSILSVSSIQERWSSLYVFQVPGLGCPTAANFRNFYWRGITPMFNGSLLVSLSVTLLALHPSQGNASPCSTLYASCGLVNTEASTGADPKLLLRVPLPIRGGGDGDIMVTKLHQELRPRASFHLSRKFFHVAMIMSIAGFYSAMDISRPRFAQGMAALDVCVLTAELVRLRVDVVNKIFLRIFGTFMRVHELNKFSGIMYCLTGVGVTAALFPKHIALLGILQLALGDPAAALFGHATRSIRWSRLKSGKGLLGALGSACILTMANTSALHRATFDGIDPPLQRVALAGLLIGAWTAVVELSVPSPQKTLPCKAFPLALDDNTALPILGAVGAACVFRLLGLGNCRLRPWIVV